MNTIDQVYHNVLGMTSSEVWWDVRDEETIAAYRSLRNGVRYTIMSDPSFKLNTISSMSHEEDVLYVGIEPMCKRVRGDLHPVAW